jgi:ASC-1-like (ASCH) protein
MSESEENKVNVRDLVNVIPPASALKGEKKVEVREKRVKLKKRGDVQKGFVIISTKLAAELKIGEEVEISVKGSRSRFKAILQDALPPYEIYANESDMMAKGLQDNSTVTLRSAK